MHKRRIYLCFARHCDLNKDGNKQKTEGFIKRDKMKNLHQFNSYRNVLIDAPHFYAHYLQWLFMKRQLWMTLM